MKRMFLQTTKSKVHIQWMGKMHFEKLTNMNSEKDSWDVKALSKFFVVIKNPLRMKYIITQCKILT